MVKSRRHLTTGRVRLERDRPGDVDNNGTTDILWRHSNGATAAWLMNDGTTSSTPSYGSTAGWSLIDRFRWEWHDRPAVSSSERNDRCLAYEQRDDQLNAVLRINQRLECGGSRRL